MNSSVKVSILIPAKNAALYVDECIQSIIRQTFQDWELIIVNDHSLDNTSKIIREYSAKDDRILLFQNNGTGIIPALRLAFQKSKGKFITRMDADDKMSPSKIDDLYQSCSNTKGIVATGLVNYFSESSLGEGYQQYTTWLNENLLSPNPFSQIYKECVIPSPCWMMRRDDLLKIGAFDSDIYPEDYDLCFRMRKAELEIATVNKVLHQWRDYPERSSRTDNNYADNRFLDLKLYHFLEQDLATGENLILWGAGKKGKHIAKYLVDKNISFSWVSGNEKKIGHNIYGVTIESEAKLQSCDSSKVILSIATPKDQEHLKSILKENSKLRPYFFC